MSTRFWATGGGGSASTDLHAGQPYHHPSEMYCTRRLGIDIDKSQAYIPLLHSGFFLFPFRVQLPLAWLWALDESTILLVKLAKDTQHGAFVYHTPTLPSTASVTRSFPSRPYIAEDADTGCRLDL